VSTFEILDDEFVYRLTIRVAGSARNKDQAIQQARDYIENHFKELRISIGSTTMTIPTVDREE